MFESAMQMLSSSSLVAVEGMEAKQAISFLPQFVYLYNVDNPTFSASPPWNLYNAYETNSKIVF